MTEFEAKARIEAWGLVQKGAPRWPLAVCPRCGLPRMAQPPSRNAVSRQADVYICSECATDEALRDWSDVAMTYSSWAYIKAQEQWAAGDKTKVAPDPQEEGEYR